MSRRTGVGVTVFLAGSLVIQFAGGILAVTRRADTVIRLGTGLCHVSIANAFLIISTVSGTGIFRVRPGRTGSDIVSSRLTLFLWRVIIRDTAGIAVSISRRFVIAELLPRTRPRVGNKTDRGNTNMTV